MILAGDIGGTKTVLGLFEIQGDDLAAAREGTFDSQGYASLEAIVGEFLQASRPPSIQAACFSIAGPVIEGRARTTNLSWELTETQLAAALRVPRVRLLNDLEAATRGMLHLDGDDLLTLQPGVPRAGNVAVIAAGTGLGEAMAYWDGARHHPFASEGGHGDFAPRTDLEVDLLRFLRAELGRVSYERVLSGPGLFNVYRFLADTGYAPEPRWLRERISAGDPSAAVAEVGLAGGHPLCVTALDLFASVYGAEAGNLALTALAFGGLFVGGGIAPKIRAKLADGAFIQAFRSKGRLSALMATIPVHVCLDPLAPLLGAALLARDLAVGGPG